MAKGKALNLDELYGQNDPVLVVYQGQEYELFRPDSWTPETYSQYVRLQKSVTEEEIAKAMESSKGFEKLTSVVDKIMQIISPELAKLDLSLEKKSRIIEHYASVVFPEELSAAKVRAKAKNLTGA